VPDLSSANRSVHLAAERIAQNTPIQGTAADILKLAMVRLREPGHGAKMVLTVHDELVFEVPIGNEVAVGEHVRASMTGVVDLAVPLLVDVGWGETWAKAKG
jgi:DNA polymerase-1